MNDLSDNEEPGRLLAEAAPGDNAPALSVSELSFALKRSVEDRFGLVRVRGELSGVKRAASGHFYFALKDENALLDGVMWKGNVSRLPFRPEDGLEVVATGKLTTYPGRSKYQIVADRMEIAGAGALMALLEQRKRQLAAEGLFAPERKQVLPYLPRVIGVVTSPTGAVIRDILHRLADRCPTRVIVWPVLVQGEGAAAQVAAAVRGFNELAPGGPISRPDLLIVARGGGSIEDLWAFNEEIVVRAVADSEIPTISAVGHETDTTLCDFAADVRAPTPTAAAEIAVPVLAELSALTRELGLRASRAIWRDQERARERLAALSRLLPPPERVIEQKQQRLDDLADRLPRALHNRTLRAKGELDRLAGALRPALLHARIDQAQTRLAATSPKPQALIQRIDRDRQRLDALWRLATSLSPDRVLERGYARVEGPDGHAVTTAAQAKKAGRMKLHFADGAVDVRTDQPGGKSGGTGKAEQPSLF
jgi:exodeoxyribonuclease VII large subunit